MGHSTIITRGKELAFLLRHDKEYKFDKHGWREVSDLIKIIIIQWMNLMKLLKRMIKNVMSFLMIKEDSCKTRAFNCC